MTDDAYEIILGGMMVVGAVVAALGVGFATTAAWGWATAGFASIVVGIYSSIEFEFGRRRRQ